MVRAHRLGGVALLRTVGEDSIGRSVVRGSRLGRESQKV
jgi:hypothetical protein